MIPLGFYILGGDPMERMKYEKFNRLRIYGSSVRCKILDILELRPMRAIELAEELQISKTAVLKNIKKLGDKINTQKTDGRYIMD